MRGVRVKGRSQEMASKALEAKARGEKKRQRQAQMLAAVWI